MNFLRLEYHPPYPFYGVGEFLKFSLRVVLQDLQYLVFLYSQWKIRDLNRVDQIIRGPSYFFQTPVRV